MKFSHLAIYLLSMLSWVNVQGQVTHEHPDYLYLNEVENPSALLVLFDGGAGLAHRISAETQIPDSAAIRGILTIGINQSEFYLTDSSYSAIARIISEVRLEIGEVNLYMGGFSLGGFTALRFAEMAVELEDIHHIPDAVFSIDAPIDHIAFVDYCIRELDRECPNVSSEIGKGEARWILQYYADHFGDLERSRSNYVSNSCFTQELEDGGNARFLLDIPVLSIHELDPMWQIQHRCRDLLDANAVSGSQLINLLYSHGNRNSEIRITSNKGYRSDGRRHPHSWSIASPNATLDWLESHRE